MPQFFCKIKAGEFTLNIVHALRIWKVCYSGDISVSVKTKIMRVRGGEGRQESKMCKQVQTHEVPDQQPPDS